MHLKSIKSGTAPWQTVLDYDFAIRKKAAELIKWQGRGFKTALKEAMEGREVRQMSFVEELAVRKNDPKPKAEPKPKGDKTKPWWEKDATKVKTDKTKKGSGKGKDKGRGKGNNKIADSRSCAIRLTVVRCASVSITANIVTDPAAWSIAAG